MRLRLATAGFPSKREQPREIVDRCWGRHRSQGKCHVPLLPCSSMKTFCHCHICRCSPSQHGEFQQAQASGTEAQMRRCAWLQGACDAAAGSASREPGKRQLTKLVCSVLDEATAGGMGGASLIVATWGEGVEEGGLAAVWQGSLSATTSSSDSFHSRDPCPHQISLSIDCLLDI